MRICSLLPSATEILYALGLEDDIVGVSHECDYPPSALRKPRVIRTSIDQDRLSSDEIDRAVHQTLERRESLYEIDQDVLRQARPELIITQELCDVCAVDAGTVARVTKALTRQPKVVSLHPHTLTDLVEEICQVGVATEHHAQAEALILSMRQRIRTLQARLAQAKHPRVFCLEWLKPLMASGHWVPEMVALAGGEEVLGRAGKPSRYVTPEDVVAARPEVLVLMPCGFPIARTRKELSLVTAQPWWQDLPAVRRRRVYLVDGPAYFNRSGPRLIDGIEILAGLLHPDRCADLIPSGASEPL